MVKNNGKLESYDEFNEKNINELKDSYPVLVDNNQVFFNSPNCGYQKFKVTKEAGQKYLHITRFILVNDILTELPTSVYPIDSNEIILHRVRKINSKVRHIASME